MARTTTLDTPYAVGSPTRLNGYKEFWAVHGINKFEVYALSEDEAWNVAEALNEQHFRGEDGEDIVARMSRLQRRIGELEQQAATLKMEKLHLCHELQLAQRMLR